MWSTVALDLVGFGIVLPILPLYAAADVFKATLPLGTAVAVAAVVGVAAIGISLRRLTRIEIAGEVV